MARCAARTTYILFSFQSPPVEMDSQRPPCRGMRSSCLAGWRRCAFLAVFILFAGGSALHMTGCTQICRYGRSKLPFVRLAWDFGRHLDYERNR